MHENIPNPPAPTAVILAGGLGTRISRVVSDRPKAMALVCGRPFITILLDQAACAGLDTVVICSGYLGTVLRKAIGNYYRSLKIEYSHETEQLGTGGAIRNALPLLTADTILVMNGDSYLDESLRNFIGWHHKLGHSASLQLAKVRDASRYGSVTVDRDNRIIGFQEKRQGITSSLINAGIYLLSRSLISSIGEEYPISLETDLFPQWVDEGLYGLTSSAKFIDIGTPHSYARAQEFFTKVAEQTPNRQWTKNSSNHSPSLRNNS